MPRLPDRQALGDPGSYRSGRRWLSASDVDASAIGKGLSSAGNSLVGIGVDMKKEAAAEGLMNAELYQATHGSAFERTFDTDPNYQTYDMKFKVGMPQISEDAAKLIPDAKMRQKWLDGQLVKNANAHDGLMKKANAMDKEKKFVGVQMKLDELQNMYTETGEDDDKRLQHQKNLEAFIQTGELGGIIDPSQGKALKDKYLKGTQLSYARTLLAKDPGKLLTQLDALPNYRPQDGLPDAQIEPRKDGLATITAPKSGAKIHVSGDYANRFAGFVKDLEANGVEINGDETGGYNDRNIAGTNRKSKHAHGEAVDINWGQNPQGDASGGALTKQLGADKVRELADKWGLKWGYDFKTAKPDPMHFEVDRSKTPKGATEGNTQVAKADTGTATDATEPPASPERTAAEQFLGRLSPEERAELKLQAKTKKTELSKAAFFSIKNDLDGVSKMVERDGKVPDGFDVQGKVEALVGMGKEAEANSLVQDLKKSEAAYKAGFTDLGGSRKPLSWSTPEEIDKHIETLAAKADGKETGEAYAQRQYALEKTQKKIEAIDKARREDPALLVEGDPEQGWAMHPAISAVQGQLYKLKLSENPDGDPRAIVLDDQRSQMMLAQARIDAQIDVGIDPAVASPITRAREKELLNIPNPGMIARTEDPDGLFKDRLDKFRAALGPELGDVAFRSAVEHLVKDSDMKELAGTLIPDLVSGKVPSFDTNRRMREAADLANFNRLMNGGTAQGMQALPKKTSQPFMAPPTEYKGAMKRTPTDMEIEGLKKFPGRARIFDQMYGPGAAAAAIGSQQQTAQ